MPTADFLVMNCFALQRFAALLISGHGDKCILHPLFLIAALMYITKRDQCQRNKTARCESHSLRERMDMGRRG